MSKKVTIVVFDGDQEISRTVCPSKKAAEAHFRNVMETATKDLTIHQSVFKARGIAVWKFIRKDRKAYRSHSIHKPQEQLLEEYATN